MADVVNSERIKKEVKMPGLDRTGPKGEGRMSGRRMGLCSGNQDSDSNYPMGFQRGFRRGAAGGRPMSPGGRRSFFRAGRADDPEQVESIRDEMAELKKRLSQLEKMIERGREG